MDITKTRLQLLPKGTSMLSVANGILAKEGLKGLYAGMSASIMRQAVYGTARLGLHREFSDRLKASQGGGDLSALSSAGSAMLAGALASVIGTPMDVCMVRMQADTMLPVSERRGYRNVFDALGRIGRTEGMAGLWQGFEPTVFRAIAMNVGMMASFDQAKQAIKKLNGENMSTTLAASAISASCASLTSLPFDMIKTRLQNQKPDASGTLPYRGVLDCAGKILSSEGVFAFWKGLSAYYVSLLSHPLHHRPVSRAASPQTNVPPFPPHPPLMAVPHSSPCNDCSSLHGCLQYCIQKVFTLMGKSKIYI